MENNRPQQIKDSHLVRKAAVYIRQSSAEQVRSNVGSALGQRDLVEIAIGYGFPRDQTLVVDDDLGLSGSAAEHRLGYQNLVRMTDANEIGLLIVADYSRGGRDDLEWYQLLVLCRLRDVLIWAAGRLYDLRNSADFLTARMLTAVAEYDLDMRRAHVLQGRDAKAKRGMPVSAPPAGYVRDESGKWVKDPDAAVRNAIEVVFRAFRHGGSLHKAVELLLEWGAELPRRGKRGVRWVKPSIGLIYDLIKNPAYRGDYVYRRRCVDPTRGRSHRGRLRVRPAQPHEMIVSVGTHEPYVPPSEFDANQRRLNLNCNSYDRGKIGAGPALLQSLIRCTGHPTRALQPAYKTVRLDGGQSYSYFCQGTYATGGRPSCMRFPGNRIDASVVAALLTKLAPLEIEQAKAEYGRSQADGRGERYRLETELRRIQQQVTDLRYRYRQCDPTNVFVARDLGSDLNSALQREDQLERLLQTEISKRPLMDNAAFDQLAGLCANLAKIFWASTTSNLERKQILRLVLDRALIVDHTCEHVGLHLVWADGSPPTDIEVKLASYASRLIEEMADRGEAPEEIAAHLNSEGLKSKYDEPWSTNAVYLKIQRLRRAARRNAA